MTICEHEGCVETDVVECFYPQDGEPVHYFCADHMRGRMMIEQLKAYIASEDAYPIVGVTVEADGTFAAWHNERQICIAGVIVEELTDKAIAAARKHAATGVTVEGDETDKYEFFPCVITRHVDIPMGGYATDPDQDVLVVFVTFMDDEMGDTYVVEGEMLV